MRHTKDNVDFNHWTVIGYHKYDSTSNKGCGIFVKDALAFPNR